MSSEAMFNDQRQVFLDNLESGTAALLPLVPGIKVQALCAGKQAGMALCIAREAQQAGQLQRVLERRYERALVFDGCFVYLDAQGTLVVWHALAPLNTPDKILSRMLSLADLEALDLRSGR